MIDRIQSKSLKKSKDKYIMDQIQIKEMKLALKNMICQGMYPQIFQDSKDQKCNSCFSDQEYKNNKLLQCDFCQFLIHEKCLTSKRIQSIFQNLWFCDRCLLLVENDIKKPESLDFPIISCSDCNKYHGIINSLQSGVWKHEFCLKENSDDGNQFFSDHIVIQKLNQDANEKDDFIKKDGNAQNFCQYCRQKEGKLSICSMIGCSSQFHLFCLMNENPYQIQQSPHLKQKYLCNEHHRQELMIVNLAQNQKQVFQHSFEKNFETKQFTDDQQMQNIEQNQSFTNLLSKEGLQKYKLQLRYHFDMINYFYQNLAQFEQQNFNQPNSNSNEEVDKNSVNLDQNYQLKICNKEFCLISSLPEFYLNEKQFLEYLANYFIRIRSYNPISKSVILFENYYSHSQLLLFIRQNLSQSKDLLLPESSMAYFIDTIKLNVNKFVTELSKNKIIQKVKREN
ncbi:hypothetical protein ABPG72_015704 [Tetrahymena utriculariae]